MEQSNTRKRSVKKSDSSASAGPQPNQDSSSISWNTIFTALVLIIVILLQFYLNFEHLYPTNDASKHMTMRGGMFYPFHIEFKLVLTKNDYSTLNMRTGHFINSLNSFETY